VHTRKFLAVLAALVALTTGAAASAGHNGVVASANGGYGFSGPAASSFFVVHPFTWNVQVHADGAVHGRYGYTQVRDGVELIVSGYLTCAVFLGNRIWVGGIIEDSSRATLIGLDMWFQAQDNGEGANDPPDMSSTIGAGGPGMAQQYCDDAPEVRFPFLLEQGNLHVRSD
jgi:hypothetical protein